MMPFVENAVRMMDRSTCRRLDHLALNIGAVDQVQVIEIWLARAECQVLIDGGQCAGRRRRRAEAADRENERGHDDRPVQDPQHARG